ncbi:MAG: hypothetical protein COA50_03790 [Flavobacteriaceae bacterium]|nr:MAG: hypothetical protein COA50_03790 [Flavobacteriaceae bacterium]
MKVRNQLILSGILVVCILGFGFTHSTGSGNKNMITWGERSLVWEDFELVRHLEEDYVASIYSGITCPDLITDTNSMVYAYMNPNLSERLRGEYDSGNVLVHEQYHFNITEYCARLLRKEIVQKGLGGLSLKIIKELKYKYSEKRDSLQNVYDSISNHNSKWEEQRFWELQIDDWLKQTAYYENEDIYGYYDFTENRTQFFRNIYSTHTQKILMSYPVGEKDVKYGHTYEIIYTNHTEKLIKFYKNGILTNGGHFNTAITKIIEKENGIFERHYLNPDETYNTKLGYCLRKNYINEEQEQTVHYYNEKQERVKRNSIYETKWKYNTKENSYYATFTNKAGKVVSNNEGIYHKKRVLDTLERTILFENLDKYFRLKNNADFIAKWELTFNEKHKKTKYRLYDENGDFAFHLEDYCLTYDYDERGNTSRVTSIDENEKITYDNNGAAIYEYTYDLFDRNTIVKRFNKDHLPIIGNDDYSQHVKEYDSLGRIQFEAFYYPGYVLKYNDDLWGASKYMYEADSVIIEQNIDAYGDLKLNENKIASIKKRLNKKKEIISEIYFDSNGNFSKNEDGVVEYRYKYNDKGRKKESTSHDSLGKLKAFDADVAIIRWEYDTYGYKSKTTYFNTENQLAITADSVTYNKYKYNSKGQLLERTNYDVNMKPALIDGVFKTKFAINQAGLDSIQFEYNIYGKLKKDVAIIKFFYNKYDNKIKTEYYNAAHKRIKNTDGISAVKIIYNERQIRIRHEFLAENNQFTNNHQGVSIKKWNLNELGHTITFSNFEKNSKPVVGANGYHMVAYEWESMGETSRISKYNTDLSLMEDEYGTAIYEYDLRPSGLYSEIKRFNQNEKLAENTLGVAITQYTPYLDGLYYLDKELNAAGEAVNDTIAK